MAGYESQVKKLLKSNGWSICHQPRGSHEVWGKNDEIDSVPFRIKSRHLANEILKGAGIDVKL